MGQQNAEHVAMLEPRFFHLGQGDVKDNAAEGIADTGDDAGGGACLYFGGL